jgi:hypothetical protein
MLPTRLEDPRRLADPRYSAEPKLDGQRAQIHVRDHRTVHAFSRPGRELIRLPGLAWLREVRWPFASALLDGEAVAGDGSEGIKVVWGAMALEWRDVDGAGDPRPARPTSQPGQPPEERQGAARRHESSARRVLRGLKTRQEAEAGGRGRAGAGRARVLKPDGRPDPGEWVPQSRVAASPSSRGSPVLKPTRCATRTPRC